MRALPRALFERHIFRVQTHVLLTQPQSVRVERLFAAAVSARHWGVSLQEVEEGVDAPAQWVKGSLPDGNDYCT